MSKSKSKRQSQKPKRKRKNVLLLVHHAEGDGMPRLVLSNAMKRTGKKRRKKIDHPQGLPGVRRIIRRLYLKSRRRSSPKGRVRGVQQLVVVSRPPCTMRL
jgi:hypothetical protein